MTNSKKQAMFNKMREFILEARLNGVRFKTFNVASNLNPPHHAGKIVVAYGKPFRNMDHPMKRFFLPVAMAFCSPKDEFTRLQGRGIAAARLLDMLRNPERLTAIPLISGIKPSDTLRLAVIAEGFSRQINWLRGKMHTDLR